MITRPLLILLALLCPLVAYAASGDSIAAPRFPVAGTVAPAATVAAAYAIGRAYPHGHATSLSPADRSMPGIDVLQYAPVAAPWIIKACGVPSASSWGRMGVAQGSAIVLNAAIVGGLKTVVSSPRPDGTDSRSFPSGHSAWAFAGATMVHREFGQQSGWYSWGAVTFASAVAMERVIDGQHYPVDVVAGASVGILAVNAGYFIADLIMGDRGREKFSVKPAPLHQPSAAVFTGNTLSLPLGPVRLLPGISIRRRPSLLTSIGLSLPAGRAVSLSVAAEVQSMPLEVATPSERFFCGSLTEAGVAAAASLRCPLAGKANLDASLAAGWHFRFNLHSRDRAVEAGSGTPLLRLRAGVPFSIGEGLSVAPGIGLELSHYSFSISQSEVYGFSAAARTSGTTCSLLLSLSTRYEF